MNYINEIILNEAIDILIENEIDDDRIINSLKTMMEKSILLSFSNENTKLGGKITTFSLPAGWTCPFAEKCKMKVSRDGKSREVGKKAEFMCYEAWMEIQYKYKRENNWRNYDLLEDLSTANEKANLIIKSLKHHFTINGKSDYVRIHEGGDFYNGEYLNAWMLVSKKMPDVMFYAYTKSLPLLIKYKKILDSLPNFKLNISAGSSKPELEGIVGYPVASVYNKPEDVLKAGEIIDLDDSIAYDKQNTNNFALLVHGMQTFEIDTPDITKNRKRNEVFMKYHKFKNKLIKLFNLPESHKINNDEAKKYINKVNELITNKKITKTNGNELIFMLRNIINYNNYNFDENLINTIPNKFR